MSKIEDKYVTDVIEHLNYLDDECLVVLRPLKNYSDDLDKLQEELDHKLLVVNEIIEARDAMCRIGHTLFMKHCKKTWTVNAEYTQICIEVDDDCCPNLEGIVIFYDRDYIWLDSSEMYDMPGIYRITIYFDTICQLLKFALEYDMKIILTDDVDRVDNKITKLYKYMGRILGDNNEHRR